MEEVDTRGDRLPQGQVAPDPVATSTAEEEPAHWWQTPDRRSRQGTSAWCRASDFRNACRTGRQRRPSGRSVFESHDLLGAGVGMNLRTQHTRGASGQVRHAQSTSEPIPQGGCRSRHWRFPTPPRLASAPCQHRRALMASPWPPLGPRAGRISCSDSTIRSESGK